MHLKMITIDCAEPRDLATFWTAALGTEITSDYEGHFVMLAPWDPAGVALGLQRVPEELAGKNRVHIDLHTEDRLAEVDRLVGLGATIVDEQKVPGLSWTVLADPAGNVFCVAGEEH
ncbi:VOC family protein [Kibdelosporangium aridum]|uniref:VOC family protein n=1 Tax=Kibdelosporangium aridum TaxID=2030 RepID=A0A428YMD9_KIBAR|nr:VOC family protein [Kibdelosporangium aridum]RSM69224.1 VOC family protein [Kibdelosporangium aridum]